MNITYRHIDNKHKFQNLQVRWQKLIKTTTEDNIYLTWEWLYRWWEVYQKDRTLFILIAEQGEELVGVFPLLKRKVITCKVIPVTRLEFLATGESEEEEVCPSFMGIAIKSGLEDQVCKGFCSYLTNGHPDKYDELFLTPLLADDPITRMLVKYLDVDSHYKVTKKELSQNLITRLEDGMEKYFSPIGKNKYKEIKKDIVARNYFLESAENYTEYFNRFIKLHNKYWDGKGAFSNEKYCNFQRKVCKDFFKNGWLKLSLLEIDGQDVAGNLDYCFNKTVYGYQTAYDKGYKTDLNLGFISMVFCLKNAVSEGYEIYDWYRYYGEDDSQQQFSLEMRNIVTVCCRENSFKNMVRNIGDSLKKLAKKFI